MNGTFFVFQPVVQGTRCKSTVITLNLSKCFITFTHKNKHKWVPVGLRTWLFRRANKLQINSNYTKIALLKLPYHSSPRVL